MLGSDKAVGVPGEPAHSGFKGLVGWERGRGQREPGDWIVSVQLGTLSVRLHTKEDLRAETRQAGRNSEDEDWHLLGGWRTCLWPKGISCQWVWKKKQQC